jgi:hypothetical protein
MKSSGLFAPDAIKLDSILLPPPWPWKSMPCDANADLIGPSIGVTSEPAYRTETTASDAARLELGTNDTTAISATIATTIKRFMNSAPLDAMFDNHRSDDAVDQLLHVRAGRLHQPDGAAVFYQNAAHVSCFCDQHVAARNPA